MFTTARDSTSLSNQENSATMNAVGTWIQAVGTVITAIAGNYVD